MDIIELFKFKLKFSMSFFGAFKHRKLDTWFDLGFDGVRHGSTLVRHKLLKLKALESFIDLQESGRDPVH